FSGPASEPDSDLGGEAEFLDAGAELAVRRGCKAGSLAKIVSQACLEEECILGDCGTLHAEAVSGRQGMAERAPDIAEGMAPADQAAEHSLVQPANIDLRLGAQAKRGQGRFRRAAATGQRRRAVALAVAVTVEIDMGEVHEGLQRNQLAVDTVTEFDEGLETLRIIFGPESLGKCSRHHQSIG